MASHLLPNYLRSNRKRLALSQDEVAFLLGAQGGGSVCRYERFARTPNLETALALEVIFQRPVSELLGGVYQTVEKVVAKRAKVLAGKVIKRSGTKTNLRKRKVLTSIANKTLITT